MLIKKIVNYIKLRRVHKIDVLLPYDPINCKCVFEPLPADNIRVIDGNVPKHNHSLDAIDAMRYSMEYFKNKEEKQKMKFLVCMQQGEVFLVYADNGNEAIKKVVNYVGYNNNIIEKTENCLDLCEYIHLANMYLVGDTIDYVAQVETVGLFGDYKKTSLSVIS